MRGLAKRAAKKRRHKQVLLSLSPPVPLKGRPEGYPIPRSHVPDLCSSHTQRVSLLHAQALRYAETADDLDSCWKAVAQAAAFAAERTSLCTRTAPGLSAAVPLTPLRCARARRRAQRRQRLRARHTLTSVDVDPHAATQLFLAHGNQRWASTLDAAEQPAVERLQASLNEECARAAFQAGAYDRSACPELRFRHVRLSASDKPASPRAETILEDPTPGCEQTDGAAQQAGGSARRRSARPLRSGPRTIDGRRRGSGYARRRGTAHHATVSPSPIGTSKSRTPTQAALDGLVFLRGSVVSGCARLQSASATLSRAVSAAWNRWRSSDNSFAALSGSDFIIVA